MIVYVLTYWVGTGRSTRDARRPALMDVHRLPLEDVTHQPAGRDLTRLQPNVVLVKVRCSAAQLTALRADPTAHVLASEVELDRVPTVAERGQLRAWLLSRGARLQDLDSATGPPGLARREALEVLRGWLKQRPVV